MMMNVLKHPSFFRPNSRPTSPAPLPPTPPASGAISSNGSSERAPRPLNKLSLSNFYRPSSSAPATPVDTVLAPLIQDGSYLEMLSLKLSEAISKALAQPTGPATANEYVLGKRPIPQGRGRALGALVASELKAIQDKPHLRKALLRSLQRPLSVLLSNLASLLLPLISLPALQFSSPPTIQHPGPNPAQTHALAIATFIQELLETFDALDLGADTDIRGDGLKPIREGLVSLLNRIMNPLFTGIRNELMPLLEALETPNTSGTKLSPATKSQIIYHPSVVTLQAIAPVYAKVLVKYSSFSAYQATLATFLVSIVWRALVALSHRPQASVSLASSPVASPTPVKKNRGNTTPPVTPPASRFIIKLPPSRPPSPPLQIVLATTAADARAIFDLLCLFPRPMGEKESTKLAREVVDDAFQGLEALAPLLDAVSSASSVGTNSPRRLSEVARNLEVLATEVPLLIALPVLLQLGCSPISIPNLIGFSEVEYRKECLSGFGRAEECAITVALRVSEVLRTNAETHPVVSKWLEMEIIEALGQST